MSVRTPLGEVGYQRLFCEENAWQIVSQCVASAVLARVVLVTNARKQVAMLEQRSSDQPDGLVIWDYHVFVAARFEGRWEVWDPDSRLGAPCAIEPYFSRSFAGAARWDPRFRPRFRVMDAGAYAKGFRSTREHMRDRDTGQWQADPPPWPCIVGEGGGYELAALWDTSDLRAGPWCDARTVVNAVRGA